MRIDFLGLQGFLNIAEQGSFQRAAAHLGLSQTALSHRMAKLEADLGVNLLVRTTRQVTLTPAGTLLLPRARELLDQLGAAFDEVRQQGRLGQQRLSIACLPTVAMSYLPRLLAQFAAAHPHLLVKVRDGTAREITTLVSEGAVEFGISVVSTNRPELEITPLVKEPFVLVCRPRHPLARAGGASWAQLADEPLIRNGVVGDALGSRREGLNWRYEVLQVATALSMVRCGLGLTIVPRLSVEAGRASGLAAVPLRNPIVARTLGILSRRGTPLSEAGEALWRMIASHMPTFAETDAADGAEPDARDGGRAAEPVTRRRRPAG